MLEIILRDARCSRDIAMPKLVLLGVKSMDCMQQSVIQFTEWYQLIARSNYREIGINKTNQDTL